MLIDIHAHTSNHGLWGLHTEDASIPAVVSLMQQYNVIVTVLMATYFPLKKSGLHNEELWQRIEAHKELKMFGSLDVTTSIMPQLRELAGLAYEGKIIGIKLYPGYQEFSPSEKKMFDIYELARDFCLPVMFHSGELHPCCPEAEIKSGKLRCGMTACRLERLGHLSQPNQAIIAVEKYPNVNFIFSHLSNPYFAELRKLMSDYGNVFTDISGQYVSGTEEDTPEYHKVITDELQQFLQLPQGGKRVMFATDFPIQSHQSTIDIIERLELDGETKKDLCFRNALEIIPGLIED